MGPIERELRDAPAENFSTFEHWYWHELRSMAVAQVIGGAAISLNVVGPWCLWRYHADILSEAIEAAEALGL